MDEKTAVMVIIAAAAVLAAAAVTAYIEKRRRHRLYRELEMILDSFRGITGSFPEEDALKMRDQRQRCGQGKPAAAEDQRHAGHCPGEIPHGKGRNKISRD